MAFSSLKDLYIDTLKDLYNAEVQLTRALPRMAKAASSSALRTALEDHLEQTQEHVTRLEKIIEKLGASPKGKRCRGMEGVIEEGSEVLEKDGDPAVLDAALILAAQKAEHYEIASYGCARTYAETMGDTKAAEILQQTLDEEGAADKKLTGIAELVIHPRAAEAKSRPGTM